MWTEREIERMERHDDPYRCQWPNVPRPARAIGDTSEDPVFYQRDESDVAAEEATAEARSEEARGR